VIVELKRNADRHQHLQAVDYTAQLWSSKRQKEGLGAAAGLLRSEGVRRELASFLRVPMEQVNRKQRILLVAEDYYLTTLRTVLFLMEHALDITLYRIALYQYPDGRYFTCELVDPEKEVDQAANSPRPPNRSPSDVQTLAGEVAAWQNPTLTAFVDAHGGTARATSKGVVFYLRANGQRVRFALDRRKKRKKCAGWVLQSQRFPADVEYWRKCFVRDSSLPEVELREKNRKKGEGRNPLQGNLPDQASFAAFLSGLAAIAAGDLR
jgi:hypothetical protein